MNKRLQPPNNQPGVETMFWSIFVDSLVLILAILAVGWVVAYLIHRRSR